MKVDTVDGTAEEGTDYRGIHHTYLFHPGQTELAIQMEILDDDDWEPDEEFFLKITLDPNSEDSGVAKGMFHSIFLYTIRDLLPKESSYFIQ